jgi:outer membrane protein assembly factor BamB
MILRLLLLLSVGTLTGLADDWTRFRGPNGFGVSDAKTVPVTFSEKSYLWKAPLPGNGCSSPIVSRGLAIVQASSDNGASRSLIAIDAATGKTKWSKEFPGKNVKVHAKSSLASGTAAADGERIFVTIWDGKTVDLHAFDYRGNELWKKPLGAYESQHGAGLSPIVVNDKVILNLDQDGRAEVIAFGAKTGDVAWRKSRTAFRACYTTPYVREQSGKKEVIVASTAGVTAYDPKDGAEVWSWSWTFSAKMPLRNVGGPVEHGGLIFAVAGDGGGDRHMVAIRPGDAEKKAELVWEKKKGTPYVPMLLARDGHLFWVADKENVAVCVEAKTGKELWQERLGGGAQVFSSPVMIDGKIYSANEKGTVAVFGAGPTFELFAKNELKEEVYASPAVADGKLFYRGSKHLICIGTK